MNGVRPIKREQVFFDDVSVGTEIPPLDKGQYTPDRLATFAAANGDFCAGHFDYRTAKARFDLDRPFAYGPEVAIVSQSQLVTDWMGPNGVLKKFKGQLRAPVYDGDSLIYKGKVAKKYSEDNENYVECEVWAERQDGSVVARGVAVVVLPTKSG